MAVATLVTCGPPKPTTFWEVGTMLPTTWWTVGIAATVAIEVGKVAMIVAPEEADIAMGDVKSDDGEERVDDTTVVDVEAGPNFVGDGETVLVGMLVPTGVLSCCVVAALGRALAAGLGDTPGRTCCCCDCEMLG